MVGRWLCVALALVLLASTPGAGESRRLPGLTFEDQEGRALSLGALRGRITVIVYGGRAGVPQHVAWGKRLDADLRARGVYRESDPPATRPIRILALAQLGGIPAPFRPMLRAFLRPRVESGYSLWLDWEDRMARLFGDHDPASTVVVADRMGTVRLVVTGPPSGPPWRAVTELLARLE